MCLIVLGISLIWSCCCVCGEFTQHSEKHCCLGGWPTYIPLTVLAVSPDFDSACYHLSLTNHPAGCAVELYLISFAFFWWVLVLNAHVFMCVSPECLGPLWLCVLRLYAVLVSCLVSVSSAPTENVTMSMSRGWVALLLLYFTKFMCVNESSRFKF